MISEGNVAWRGRNDAGERLFSHVLPGQRAEHGSRASERVAWTFGRMRPPIRCLGLLLKNAAAVPDILAGPTARDLPPD